MPLLRFLQHCRGISLFFTVFTIVAVLITGFYWHEERLHESAYWIATPVLGAAGALFLMWVAIDANRPSRTRLRYARRLMREGRIRSVDVERTDRPRVARPMRFGSSFLLIASGTLIVTAAGLWIPHGAEQYNAEAVPTYLSPGAEFRFAFPNELDTVRKYWKGRVEASARNAEGGGQSVPLSGEALDDEWPETIRREGNNGKVEPKVVLRLPDDPALAGKPVDVRIVLEADYPVDAGHKDGSFRYHVMHSQFEQTIRLRLTDSATVNRLFGIWWACAIFGSMCVLVPPLNCLLRSTRAIRENQPELAVAAAPEPRK